MDVYRRFVMVATALALLATAAAAVFWAGGPLEPWVFFGCGWLVAALVLFT